MKNFDKYIFCKRDCGENDNPIFYPTAKKGDSHRIYYFYINCIVFVRWFW